MSTSTHSSKACCTIPFPASTSVSSYTPKGTFITHANTKCYMTGPTDAKKAVFFIYDIFGFRSPTLLGADMLADAGYLVMMPDLFDGEPAEPEWLAQDTEEKKSKFASFREKLTPAEPYIERIYGLLGELRKEYPSVEKGAGIGFCWGGKLVSLTSGQDRPWTCAVQSSPARVDPEDAKKVGIPIMMLASKDEPKDAVEGFEKELKGEKIVKTFDDMIHGWMSARADLEGAEGRKGFEEGWGMVVEFLGKHL